MVFKKGHIPWNKNLKGIHLSPKTEFKEEHKWSEKIEKQRRKSIGIALTGRKKSKTHKINISKGVKKLWNNLDYRKHMSDAHIDKMKGELSYRWIKDRSFLLYPDEFNKNLKKNIRERDENKCIICNKKGNKLDVHHIDYNKKNCNPNNLILLCRSCHTKTGTGNRKYWEWQLKIFMNLFKNSNHNTIFSKTKLYN